MSIERPQYGEYASPEEQRARAGLPPLGADPVVLVVGAEGRGLSRLTRETCDQIVSIPMAQSTESLNASVATSIALYEIAGKREAEGLA